jgi:hypothetical protein
MSRPRAGVILLGVLLAAGCTADEPPAELSRVASVQAVTRLPTEATTIVDGSGSIELAIAASRALFASAPVVVLVSEKDLAEQAVVEQASSAAVRFGLPLLVTPEPAEVAAPAEVAGPGESAAVPTPAVAPAGGLQPDADLAAEIARLAAHAVLAVGPAAADWAQAAAQSGPLAGIAVLSTVDDALLGEVRPPSPTLAELVVIAVGDAVDAAAVTTARAAGAMVRLLGAVDPRATSASVHALAGGPVDRVLALGSAFGPAERLRQRLDTAVTGVELPGGGQVLFPGRRMVALYGHPGDPGLGVLGEQPVEAAIARARQLADSYAALFGEPVVPTFEIITTVASAGAGADGNYSNEVSVDTIRPWVQAARAAGIYVVLDLQPGRTDFLSQAKLYAELLAQPHVGLALDPEWRLAPGQVHMVQIGSVSADEINQVGQWLAELTRTHRLPQKVLMLHQFRLDMISNRPAVVTDYDELRVVIHADGFGSPGAKQNTWNTLRQGVPAHTYWGWKNFYDEDKPTFTPQQTVGVSPEIVFISYQ